MGADSKKKPPLPAPTESDSTAGISELATNVSKATEKSSYSIPEDGSPITISTRRKREKEGDGKISHGSHPSQTSLLIEYFEAGKDGKSDARRPSVRVRVTPSSHRKSKSTNDHIQITESKGNRNPSYTKRISLNNFKDEQDSYEKSLSEATGSNATSNGRGPIEIDVAPRRHGSPLIPSEANNSTYVQEANPSDISSMPANSFLDGGASTQSPRRKRSKSLSTGEALATAAAAGLATATVADTLRAPTRSGSRSRSLSKERIAQKAVEKIKNDQQTEKRRKHSSKSRARSASGEKESEGVRTPRRRSSRNAEESLVSGTDSSLLSSHVAPSQQSFRSGTSKSSLNNPKLLETVEDAIRRLIIPELTAIKREQSKHAQRRDRDRERRGSVTSGSVISRGSREEISGRPRVTLNGKEVSDGDSSKGRKEGDRESALSSERSFERGASEETVTPGRDRKKRTSSERHRGIEALAAGGAIGALTAAALHKHDSKENLDETRERRRRRNKGPSPGPSQVENVEEKHAPPMPMISDVNSSEMTRTSIRSAETDRPLSASQEQLGTPIHEVSRGTTTHFYGSPSPPSSGTPTRTPIAFHQGLGTQHANYSRGDLSLRSQNSERQLQDDEYEVDEYGQKVPMHDEEDDYYEEEDEPQTRSHAVEAGVLGAAAGAGLATLHHRNNEESGTHSPIFSPYGQYTQQVPPPLRYVPYAQENRRGLSPIQSVSSWREDDRDDPNHRDSVLTRSVRSYSSLGKQSQQQRGSVVSYNSLDSAQGNQHDFGGVREGGLAESEVTQDSQDREYWEEQRRMNAGSQEFDNGSYRGSEAYSDRTGPGQNVRSGAGANVQVHTPVGVESAQGSIVNASILTGGSNQSGNSAPQRQADRKASYASFEEGSERHFTSRGNSPVKEDAYGEVNHQESRSQNPDSQRSTPNKFPPEYELDENGRKVTMPSYRRADLLGAGAIGAAAGMAAGALAGRNHHNETQDRREYDSQSYGTPQNKSFKERAMENIALAQSQSGSPQRSAEKLVEDREDRIPIKMSASGIPDVHDPMPEIGYGDAESEVTTNPSIIHGPIGGTQHGSRDHWSGQGTPPQTRYDSPRTANSRDDMSKAARVGLAGAAIGAGLATAREHENDPEDEWGRTSEERKRDTLITNPYEDTPFSQHIAERFDSPSFEKNLRSPLAAMKDEGYISSAPNGRSPDVSTPERRTRGSGFHNQEGLGEPSGADPFYTPKHSRHLSGISDGLDSSVYEGATGIGMDKIQNKDIRALMDHLTVRDAQRQARDTEILITLVRAAAENRNQSADNRTETHSQFEDLKRLLADTEDVIITEVQRNTDKSVQKVIMGGPRPLTSSAPRSLRSQDLHEQVPTKRTNMFKRALKGLGVKSTNDLGKIEDMLNQILVDVEDLKRQNISQQRPQAGSRPDSYNDIQQGAYEQDLGYEPEGHAGTSTASASHASHSGYFSNPHSRGTSAVRGFDGRRDFSDHRISTVPEGDEDELDEHEQTVLGNQFENNEALLTPTHEIPRGASAPLNTPPPQVYVAQASNSNENTPKTDKSKKHKSSSSSGWLPKISRWSETTASTVAKGFRSNRSSKQKEDLRPASKSGSDLGSYDGQDNSNNWDYHESDKLHSGFSQDDILQNDENEPLASQLPPEDPKYKAHRNSLNLQHPQPRPGPTHRYQTALEVQAQDFRHPQSPKSVDWGSNTSLNRLPQINNRYSTGTGNLSPVSDGGIPYSPDSMHTLNQNLTSPAPPRPPKEPLNTSTGPERPPKIRNKLSKPSPLNNQVSAEHLDHYRTSSPRVNHNLSPVYGGEMGSPRSAERRPSALGGVPPRKPTGPRSMSTASKSGDLGLDRDNGTVIKRNVNRDTFGTIASHHSGESEIF